MSENKNKGPLRCNRSSPLTDQVFLLPDLNFPTPDTESEPEAGEESGTMETESAPEAGATSDLAETESGPEVGEESDMMETESEREAGEKSDAVETEPGEIVNAVPGRGRKPVIRFTREEHRRFVEGLERFGKREWQEIANYMKSRTKAQVISHAQKYFRRLSIDKKDRRRASIHDLTRP